MPQQPQQPRSRKNRREEGRRNSGDFWRSSRGTRPGGGLMAPWMRALDLAEVPRRRRNREGVDGRTLMRRKGASVSIDFLLIGCMAGACVVYIYTSSIYYTGFRRKLARPYHLSLFLPAMLVRHYLSCIYLYVVTDSPLCSVEGVESRL